MIGYNANVAEANVFTDGEGEEMAEWKRILREELGPGAAIWPLRLFLGFTFIRASWDKLFDPAFFSPAASGYVGHQLALGAGTSPLGGLLTGFIVPNATMFGMLTMAGELLIGLAVLLGWYTRFSAIMGLFINLMFYFTITWDVHPYYYGADIIFVISWLTLALTGPGPLSVDAYMRKRVQGRGVAATPASSPVAGARVRSPVAAGSLVRPPARTPAGASTAVRTPGAPGTPARPAATPPARPGERSTVVTRVGPASHPEYRRVPGRSSQAPGVRAADMTRRQFNVLGLSALAAAAIGLLEMAAWPVLHSGSGGGTVTQPGSPNPAGGTGPVGPAAPSTTAAPAGQAPTAAPPSPHGQQIASAGQLPAGQALEFTNPSDSYPGVLVHNDSGYSAFYAVCTHQGCQVSYIASTHLIGCPCHGALFDPSSNGQAVRGPARQPLQAIPITVGPDGTVYLAS